MSTQPLSPPHVRIGRYSLLLHPRAYLVSAVLVVALAVLALLSIMVGSTTLMSSQVIDALWGQGPRRGVLHVWEVRLPRAIVGALTGAGLGLAGHLTQTMARNRLATPDLLGVSQGATTAILISLAGSATGFIGHWWVGPIGAICAVALVVLIAGGLEANGHRFLVVGLAVSMTASAVTDLALARQGVHVSAALYTWTIGNLNGRGMEVAIPVALGLAVLFPLAVALTRTLTVLRFDDDMAAGLGVNLARARLTVLATAVGLAGLAVGVGGPIAFVALAAPVMAVRLNGPNGVPLPVTALVGACLVLAADTLGRVAFSHELPVGVISGVLGGPFLLWVLLSDQSTRKTS